MDNYNRLLLKEGGDRPGRLALSNYTSTEKLLSIAQGPVKLQKSGALFTISELDLQNGTASVFVVVWSRDHAAAASTSVSVRSQVVADIDVPSFVFAGDRALLPLRLENIDFFHQGEFSVQVCCSQRRWAWPCLPVASRSHRSGPMPSFASLCGRTIPRRSMLRSMHRRTREVSQQSAFRSRRSDRKCLWTVISTSGNWRCGRPHFRRWTL